MTSAVPSERTALGIDLGTSSVRLGVVDLGGRIVGAASRPLTVHRPHVKRAEADPDQWWAAVVDAAGDLDSDLRGSVGAIGISTLFPAVVPVDREGRALARAILYTDRRASDELLEGRPGYDRAQFVQRAGNRPDPGCTGALNILWWRKHEAQLHRRAAQFLPANAWLTLKLTGRAVTDPTQAAIMGLFDAGALTGWDCGLCRLFDVAEERLPRVVDSAANAGGLSDGAADALGLVPRIPVAPGAGDSAAGTIGAGVREPGRVLAVCGSTDNVVSLTAAPAFSEELINSPYPVSGRWWHCATISSTGVALEWAAAVLGLASVDELVTLAGQSQAGSAGVVFLPYLQGERTGVWDERASGVLLGLTAQTERRHIARAVLEGVALALGANVALVERIQQTTCDELVVTGGGVRSDLSCQVRADALGIPVRRRALGEMTLRGAAWLGARAAKLVSDDVPPASGKSEDRVFEPDMSARGVFERRAQVFKGLYADNAEAMHELAREWTQRRT